MGKGLHERYLYCKNITQIFVLLWGYDLNLYPCGDGVLVVPIRVDDYVEVELELDELDVTSAESKATYKEIQEYVLKDRI